ncbi:hypothetical protein B0H14DRAFT_3514356 [Mycena olivaceomarginata]|nr:hypothetical protein B0H14DRAFT_3514356 [Mycena olivaceomarginata]
MTWMVAHTFVDILALDNASANNVLLQALAWLLMSKFDIQFVPANSQVRCLAHVVNLVVQRLLAALDDAEDPDTADDYLPNKDRPFHYDPNDDPELSALECEVFTNADSLGNEEDEAAELLTGLASEFANMSPLQKVNA